MWLAVEAHAAGATDIAFVTKKSTLLGNTYHIYNVRCSSGKKAQVSAWDEKKTWCKGTRKERCYRNQLKAANAVCR